MSRQLSFLISFFKSNHLNLLDCPSHQTIDNPDDHMKTPSMQWWVICKVIRSVARIEVDQSAYRLVSIVSAEQQWKLPSEPTRLIKFKYNTCWTLSLVSTPTQKLGNLQQTKDNTYKMRNFSIFTARILHFLNYKQHIITSIPTNYFCK